MIRRAVLVVGLLGCGGEKVTIDGGVESPVVATVGDRVIRERDLQARLESEPPLLREAYSNPERRKELVTELARTGLMVDEARRRGLDSTPGFQQLVDRLLVQQLTQELSAEAKVDEQTVRRYFDEHQDEFVRPERLRVAHVLFGALAGDPAKRKAAREAAEKARAALLKLKPSEQAVAFAALARAQSTHEESRAQGGDLGLRTREELEQLWGEGVGQAARVLKPGELSPVVESDRGIHLIEVLAHQPGSATSFDDARAGIRLRLEATARAAAVRELTAQLEKSKPIRFAPTTR